MSKLKLPAPLSTHGRFSDWISFCDTGLVVIRSGRVELGQGVGSALTRIAAAELHLDRSRIRLVSGDTRSCPNEGYTAGSLSISVGGLAVRAVTRAAMIILRQQAAMALQADPVDISINDGAVQHGQVDSGLTIWDLARDIDWQRLIPDDTPLDAPHTHELNDSSVPNDLLQRLSGSGFIHDLDFPGMQHARVITPDDYRATLKQSADDLKASLPFGVTLINVENFLAVVSEREELAVAAAESLHALSPWSETRELESVPDSNHPLEGYGYQTEVDYIVEESENLDGCEPVEETEVSVCMERPCISHASIGPGCAVAVFRDSTLQIYSHSQGVFALRNSIATMLDLAVESVEVIHHPGAGCYGHNSADDVAADAAITAMQLPDVPIRMQYSRADEFCKSPLGPAMRTESAARLDANGKLAFVRVSVTSPPHSSRPGTEGAMNLRSAMLIAKADSNERAGRIIKQGEPPLASGGGSNRNAIPGYRIPAVEVVTNKIHNLPYRVSSLRSLGAFVNVLSIESLMDECAIRANIDSASYRLQSVDSIRGRSVIERAVEISGFRESHGDGIAYAQYKNMAGYCACIARVTVEEEIRVEKLWVIADVGEIINPDGVRAQLEGGAIQSMSWLLYEQAPIAVTGTSVTGWDDYPIATFTQIPSIHIELTDGYGQPPLGCGEASQGPVAAAIYNATCRQLGARPGRLPLTRERLTEQLLR